MQISPEVLVAVEPQPGTPDLHVRATVLVVDDSEAQRYTVVRALRAEGFDVLEAETGYGALEVARLNDVDVVVLDVELPDLNGYEVCRQLKAATTTLLPVMHLSSARTTGAARARGLDAGADGYLTHPFEPDELRAAVRALVRLRHGEQRRIAESAAASLLQQALDALPDHIVLLGPTGDVVATNESWTSFGVGNGYANQEPARTVNYLDVCERASGAGSDSARAAAAGIRRVLAGEMVHYAQEYDCHSPTEERWFRMTVRPMTGDGPVAAIITHTDRTPERLAARAESDARERADAAGRAQAADEAFFRAITERSLEFVWIMDEGAALTYVTPSVDRLLGSSADELLGRPPFHLVHEEEREAMIARFAEVVRGGPNAVVELSFRVRHRDGSWRWMEGAAQNFLHDPAVKGITGNARDVTARVEAERARADSDVRFRRFVETTLEGVIAIDPAGLITYANAKIGEMLRVAPGDLHGRSVLDFMTAEDAFALRLRIVDEPHAWAEAIETQLCAVDGAVIDVRAAVSPILDSEGRVGGHLAMLSDITERTRADIAMADALRTADLDRRRLEAIMEAIPVGVWLVDAGGEITHLNPAARTIWGDDPTASGVREKGAYQAWWPSTGVPLAREDWAISRAMRTLETVSGDMLEIQRFDGRRGYVLNSVAPILDATGSLTGSVVVNVDMTAHHAEAKEREVLLASLESERRHLAEVFDKAPAFLAVARGPRHVFERTNPAYMRLIGGRDVIGRPVAEALPEIAEQGLLALLDAVRNTGEPFIAAQIPVQLARTEGGPLETRYLDLVYQRLDQPDGDHAIVAHGVDVTDQVMATRMLVESKQRLHEQFAKLPVPTYLWEERGPEFVLLECNEAARELVPASCSTPGQQRPSDIFSGTDDLAADFRRCLREGTVVRRSVHVDLPAPRGRRVLDVTMGPQQPDRVLVHAVDTTDRTELEAQLRQAQKMDAVGRLAGGVAHDFNNLLTVIGAHSAFLLETLDPSDPEYEDATAIHQAGIRAAGLTRQLLAFSRKQILKPVVADLNATVAETRAMLSRLLGEDIEIVTELAPGLPKVVADTSQMDQVVVNLAVNARDAMPNGGRLTLRTRLVTLGDDGRPGIVPPGVYVSLCVTDTGIGMDSTVQSRLFEPFFTTKELGKGTGLGLATVYGIVKQSAGYILVDSVVGRGSTFEVLLPAVVAGEEAEHLQEAKRSAARGVETVLLVEDETAVREVAKRVLRRLGYVVLEAGNGEEALAVSRDFASRIHLVISDAVMPGMSGIETVRRLQAERPTLRALFMSGYTDDEIVRRGIVSAELPFVQKPFALPEFGRAVREALDT